MTSIGAVVLRGSLVRLEPLRQSHVPDLAQAAEEDRSAYAYSLVPRADETAEYVAGQLARDGVTPFAQVRVRDEVAVGCTSFFNPRAWPGREELCAVEIGWTWLAASAQRTGINGEAKLLLLTHAFETLGVARVDLKADARNQRSRQAIERLGARFEGVLRNWSPSWAPGEEGTLRDCAIFSVTAAEWPTVKSSLARRITGPVPGEPLAAQAERCRPQAANGTRLASYDGLIVDLDGVIWRGGDPIPGARDGLAAVRASGTRVVFVTNDPSRTPTEVAGRLSGIGIPATADDVLTSSAATVRVAALDSAGNTRVLVVGPPALRELARQEGLEVIDAADAARAGVVIVGGHEGFNYGELRAAADAIRAGARLYATGRDAVFPAAAGLQPATGAILAAIETAGGVPATIIAKPEPIMFRLARAALAGCERIAVIGDHLVTDIAGAKRAELDAILVLTGVTRRADIAAAPLPPDHVLDSMAAFAESAMRNRKRP